MYYPPAIKEDASSSFEASDAPKEVEAAGPGAVLAVTSPNEPVKESEPFGVVGANEGQNPDAPQKTAESTGNAPISHAERPVLLVKPLQAVTLGEGSENLETSPTQLSEEGADIRSKE